MVNPADHVGLCRFVAARWVNTQQSLEFDELVSICYLVAVDKLPAYDGRGAVSTFLMPRMNWAIVDELRRLRPGKRAPVQEQSLDELQFAAPTDVEAEALLTCAIDQVIAEFHPRQQAVARSLLQHGLGEGTQQRMQHDCPNYTPKTLRLVRGKVSAAIKGALHEVV